MSLVDGIECCYRADAIKNTIIVMVCRESLGEPRIIKVALKALNIGDLGA
jgi:hypothetical protein